MKEVPWVGCEDWLRLDADHRIWLKKDGSEAYGPVPGKTWDLVVWVAG